MASLETTLSLIILFAGLVLIASVLTQVREVFFISLILFIALTALSVIGLLFDGFERS